MAHRPLGVTVAQVCLMVAKVASGRAEHAEGEEEEKLALEGPPRRSSSRHHSRHLGNTSSPGSSSLDTAVSLPRCVLTCPPACLMALPHHTSLEDLCRPVPTLMFGHAPRES